jgi:uncharacterized protein YciI
MNYYILVYKTVENYIDKRAPFRQEHLGLAEHYSKRYGLVMAGALDDPADEALLVFKGETDEAARRFVQNDPYVKNGLIQAWYIRKWKVVVSNG